jgi:thiol-disulfide isomerase/thioredoxin
MRSLLLLFLLIAGVSSYSQGIQFLNNPPLDSVLKTASITGQLIFVDMYTTWCMPCKKMDSTVFNKDTVGKRFNKQFINLKIDAEKGEGLAIDKKYQVDSYPTYLFINAAGELVYKYAGTVSIPELFKLTDVALKEKEDPKPIAVWEQEYSIKKKDKGFMEAYLTKRAKLGLRSTEEYDVYLQLLTPQQKLSEATLQLIVQNGSPLELSSNTYQLLINNYTYFQSHYPHLAAQLFSKVEPPLRIAFHVATKENNSKALAAFLRINNKMHKVNPAQFEPGYEYEETFYRLNKRTKDYLAIVVPAIEKNLMNKTVQVVYSKADSNAHAHTLTTVSAYIAKNVNDQKMIGKAKAWVEKAIQLKPTLYPTYFLVWHTYAGILYQLGEKATALQYQEKAVQLMPADETFFKEEIVTALEKMQAEAAIGGSN